MTQRLLLFSEGEIHSVASGLIDKIRGALFHTGAYRFRLIWATEQRQLFYGFLH